jgi:hypothetical protein
MEAGSWESVATAIVVCRAGLAVIAAVAYEYVAKGNVAKPVPPAALVAAIPVKASAITGAAAIPPNATTNGPVAMAIDVTFSATVAAVHDFFAPIFLEPPPASQVPLSHSLLLTQTSP